MLSGVIDPPLLNNRSGQVGVAAQLPSGAQAETDYDYHSFFDFLLNGGEAYETIPPSRLNVQQYVRQE